MVAGVLNPTQKMFAIAWRETTTRVETEMQKMHSIYSDLLKYEKNITEQAIETCKQLKTEADAVRAEKAKVEAERDEALGEAARLRNENLTLKQNMASMSTTMNAEIDAMRKYMDRLLEERKRFSQEWILARSLRVKLYRENTQLMEELRRRSSLEDAGAPLEVSDHSTKETSGAEQASLQTLAVSHSPSTTYVALTGFFCFHE